MGWRNKYLVRVIVKNSGLSREEFCKATGERWSEFDAFFNGFAHPKPDRIARWAMALGKTTEELLGE